MSWLSEAFKKVFIPVSPVQRFNVTEFQLVLMDQRGIKFKYPDSRIGSANIKDRIIYVPYTLRNGKAEPDFNTLGHELWHLVYGKFHS